MKKFLVVLMVFAVSIFIGVGSSIAAPFNVRPITDPPAVLVPPHGEQTLGGAGGIFATIGATTYAADPVGTQSNVAIFTNQGSGGAVASFIISIAGNANVNQSGLYNASGTLAPIFQNTSGLQSPTAQATVSFLANGTVVVSKTVDPNNIIIAGNYPNFGNLFGFYLKNTQTSVTFYSEDSKNPGGNAQALVYQGNGSDVITVPGFLPGVFSTDEWVFAFEDVAWASADKDFNDMVYIVESIGPGKVPEPISLILLGSGLAGAGLYRRFRKPRG